MGDHVSAKLKKPECHVEWEDVTTPHCETYNEQVCVEEFQNQCHTEFSTSWQTEYNTQCKTEYQELCETTDHQKCHTEHDQQCHEEFSEECKTEYSEECRDIPREACHTESSQECSTKYSEVCETEHEQACHTEYSEECRDEPECWVEEKEECQDVQIKVQHRDLHQPKQKWSKWKRSVDGEVLDAEDVGDVDDEEEDGDVDDDEEDGGVPAGEESVVAEAVATEGSVRKERSLKLARKIGRKIVSIAAKKHVLKDKFKLKKASLKDKKLKKASHVKKAPKVVHQTERVCRSVPFKQCTSHQVCEQVP